MNPDLPSLLLPLGVVVPQRPDLETAWSRRDFQCDDDVANADGFAAQANADRLYALALEQALREMAGKVAEANTEANDYRLDATNLRMMLEALARRSDRYTPEDIRGLIGRLRRSKPSILRDVGGEPAPCATCGGTRSAPYAERDERGRTVVPPCPACTGAAKGGG
jgi:hypothetical protein